MELRKIMFMTWQEKFVLKMQEDIARWIFWKVDGNLSYLRWVYFRRIFRNTENDHFLDAPLGMVVPRI